MNRFKKWYSVSEAAALLRQVFEEAVTERDVLDRINAGELGAWLDATGCYAVEVAPGCVYYPDPARNPLFPCVQNPQGEQLAALRRGSEDLFEVKDTVEVLTGHYRLADLPRDDVLYFDGPEKASIHFAHGFLVRADDGKTTLKIVRRLPAARPDSRNACDFFADIKTPASSADLRIAAEDLLAIISSPQPAEQTGTRERETLLRQLGALALLLSAKASLYRRGDRPNARQIAAAVADMADALPDADRHGLSSANIRKNISEGVSLLERGETG
ncbi:hypothetical protein AB3X94_01030 [Paraburkholderia sp. BR10923]|uniref:hypothetical protein n=1 Tax=Paraburkholderia sp. BR10923 TaxID=3236992 RepID=UPI0034CF5989